MSLWKTEEQEAWLTSHIPAFLKAQQARRTDGNSVGDFYEGIYSAWFKRWPEPDSAPISKVRTKKGEKIKVVLNPIESRRGQIRKWFYWATSGRTARQSKPGKFWLRAIQNKFTPEKTRPPCNLLSLYHSLYKEKINAAVNEKIQAAGVTSRTAIGTIRQDTLKAIWADEEPAIRAQVEATHKQNKAEYDARKNEPFETDSDKPSPEDYYKSINAIPSVLRTTMDALAESTGWVFFIAAAGPNPVANGKIWMQDHYFGPRDSKNRDFRASFSAFETGFEAPFSDHIVNCFLLESRNQWILGNASAKDDIGLDSIPMETDQRRDKADSPPPLRTPRRRTNWTIISDVESEDEDDEEPSIPRSSNADQLLDMGQTTFQANPEPSDHPMTPVSDTDRIFAHGDSQVEPASNSNDYTRTQAASSPEPDLPDPSMESPIQDYDFRVPGPAQTGTSKDLRKGSNKNAKKQAKSSKKLRSRAKSREMPSKKKSKENHATRATPTESGPAEEEPTGRGKRIKKLAKDANGDFRYEKLVVSSA